MGGFSEAMRRIRLDAGLSLRELARRVPIDPGYLSRLENGTRQPTAALAAAVDTALDADGELAALAPQPDPVDTAARESERIARLIDGDQSRCVAITLHNHARTLALDYRNRPKAGMLDDVTATRRQALDALRRGRITRPGDATDVTAMIGYLSGVLAYVALDLGKPAAAMTHTDAAWSAAEAVDHNQLRAWVRGTQSLIHRFAGNYRDALAYAEDGLRYADTGTARVRLLCGVAQCHANVTDAAGTHRALAAATLAREHMAGFDLMPGLFGFSEAKQAYYSGSSLIWLTSPKDLTLARDQADQAVRLWSAGDEDDRSLDDEALAKVYAATAAVQLHDLEQAAEYLEPILGLPEDRRISWIRKRMMRVAGILAARPYVSDRLAVELRERIDQYT